MYITLEVFYLKHSGENTNVIKLQKTDDHLWTTSDINFKSDNKDILSSSLDTFTDDQPGKEWIICGVWWYNNHFADVTSATCSL